jgi:tetratricopeptide (TPR) repeat protein
MTAATDHEIEKTLSAARARGESFAIADALAVRANHHVQAGRLPAARADLLEAAELHGDAARAIDQARCLCFAATLSRGLGELERAQTLATSAGELAPPHTPAAVSAATELGEIAMMRGDFARAAASFGVAFEHGVPAGLNELSRAALHRVRARALAALGRKAPDVEANTDALVADLDAARALYLQLGELAEARRTGVELATALQDLGRSDESRALCTSLGPEATVAGDHSVLADLALLSAGRAIEADAIDEAIGAAAEARNHALAGVVPTTYAGAAITIAELEESRDRRVEAYEALAVGWATLSDLLGDEIAKATFEPRLTAQRKRWGDDAFREARDTYYARRKQQLATT